MNPITIKLVFDLLVDREELELFDLHYKYRLTPSEINRTVKFLEKENVINHNNRYIRLNRNLSKEQLRILYNSICNRKLELEKEKILALSEQAKPISEFYKPNLRIIDKSLKLDKV